MIGSISSFRCLQNVYALWHPKPLINNFWPEFPPSSSFHPHLLRTNIRYMHSKFVHLFDLRANCVLKPANPKNHVLYLIESKEIICRLFASGSCLAAFCWVQRVGLLMNETKGKTDGSGRQNKHKLEDKGMPCRRCSHFRIFSQKFTMRWCDDERMICLFDCLRKFWTSFIAITNDVRCF